MKENHRRGHSAAARPASRALACPAAQGHQQPRLHRRGAARGAKAPRRGGRRRPESAGRAQERTRSRPRSTERQTVSPKGWDGREAGLWAILARVPQGRWLTDEGERDEAPEGEEVAQPGVRRLQPRRRFHLCSVEIVLVLDRVRLTFGRCDGARNRFAVLASLLLEPPCCWSASWTCGASERQCMKTVR